MSASKHVTIWCDGKRADGGECVDFIESGELRVPKARTLARAEGWRCTSAGDFCPVHTDQAKPR